jgi:pSer/pThr/pTyr-binding forkhead associated (FHA) protein
MAKIILSMDSVVLQEMQLTKERITIGRRPHNDLVINNSAISAEHAVIVTILRDAVLQDLNSTNGTRVNGQPIKKHFLKNNDVIELAKYKIRFIGDQEVRESDAEYGKLVKSTVDPNHKHDKSDVNSINRHQDGNTVILEPVGGASAVLKVLTGGEVGKEIQLSKLLTTIGEPGKQLAVVTRRGTTFSLTHVAGKVYPLVNGTSIGPSAYVLASGDVVDLSEMQLAFSLC